MTKKTTEPEKKCIGIGHGKHAEGCKHKPRTDRSSRSHACQRAVRKVQLKANNATWRKRKSKGKAGHHVKYRGKPTKAAKVVKQLGKDPAKVLVPMKPAPQPIEKAISAGSVAAAPSPAKPAAVSRPAAKKSAPTKTKFHAAKVKAKAAGPAKKITIVQPEPYKAKKLVHKPKDAKTAPMSFVPTATIPAPHSAPTAQA